MVFRRRDRPPILHRLREGLFPRRGWRRSIEYLGHRVKRLPDTPHRVALGFACGVFVSFTPFFGAHFLLAAFLAWAFRGNVVAGLIGTAAGNPLTFPFIAWTSLALGQRILGYGATGRDFGRVTEAFIEAAKGLWATLLSLFGIGESEWLRLVLLFQEIVWPYFVGGLLPGLVAAILAYYLVRPLIAAYQAARAMRLRKRARERVHAVNAADAAGSPPYTRPEGRRRP